MYVCMYSKLSVGHNIDSVLVEIKLFMKPQ